MAIKDDQRTRKERREEARAKRQEIERQQAAAAARRRRLTWIGGGIAVVAIVAVIVLASSGGGGGKSSPSTPKLSLAPASSAGHLVPAPAPGPTGPEGVAIPPGPTLAQAEALAPGASVDGINSEPLEQLAFHIHAHLTIFVNGSPRQVPLGIGITPPLQLRSTAQGSYAGGSGFAWLHTHAADGIIHIESPVTRVYTLGDFFDIWNQPLSSRQVGPATGTVTAFYNGSRYVGDPRNIPLSAHAQIQLDVGTPIVSPETTSFPGGL